MPDSLDVTFTVKELFMEIRKDLRELNSHVNELERRGSDQAQRSVSSIKDLEDRVTRLQMQAVSKEAVEQFQATITKLAFACAISILGMIANALVMYFRH